VVGVLCEWILRKTKKVRPIITREDKDYLTPIFEEVYQDAKRTYPDLSPDIQ
jgi:hypothetical protein